MNTLNLPILNRTPSSVRFGITIIEVLTAMVVAMIGVFGIMILIPFAIKQSETGLDIDTANLMGRNANEIFEINGFDRLIEFRSDRDGDGVEDVVVDLPVWFALDADGNEVRVGNPIPVGPPETDQPGIDVYSIDPLSIMAKGNGLVPNRVYGQFPPFESLIASGLVPNEIEPAPPNYRMYDPVTLAPNDRPWFPHIPEANVGIYNATDGSVSVLDQLALANELFRNRDDLEFGQFDLPATDTDADSFNDLASLGVTDNLLLPPRMYFDIGSAGTLRRQSRGEISWQMIVAPVKDNNTFAFASYGPSPKFFSNWFVNSSGWKFRQHTLVWENRVLDPNAAVMPVAPVVTVDGLTPPEGVHLNGGTITIDLPVVDVRKNDWIMLVNRIRSLEVNAPPAGGAAPPFQELGFEKQIEFYRVVDAFFDETAGQSRISLDGPDFDFGPLPGPQAGARTTYAVHLVNFDAVAFSLGEAIRVGSVINVYERTYVPKGSSFWNR